MNIRPRNTSAKISNIFAGMVAIPRALKPLQQTVYPPNNAIAFERWYMENFSANNKRQRIYLPIQWTALYCNNQFGENKNTIRQIQNFINSLDRSKKYYTIVQYDDGILNDVTKLDIKVFAMSGPRIDYPLPLLCCKHNFKFPGVERDIFASFVGSMTHPIRAIMRKQLKDKPGYYVTTEPHSIKDYCRILARSKYALCPRGYGQSSFRIQEAIDYGAVPVYISDEFIFPYRKNFDYGIALSVQDNISDVLEFTEEADLKYIKPVDKHLFTYAGCKVEILKELENELV